LTLLDPTQIVTSLSADDFGDWEGKEFAPEAKFLDKLKVEITFSNRTGKKARPSIRTQFLRPTSEADILRWLLLGWMKTPAFSASIRTQFHSHPNSAYHVVLDGKMPQSCILPPQFLSRTLSLSLSLSLSLLHFSSCNYIKRNESPHAIPSTFDIPDYFLEMLTIANLEIAAQAIDGVSQVETQTYTIMPM
jgi:hypothetical protein